MYSPFPFSKGSLTCVRAIKLVIVKSFIALAEVTIREYLSHSIIKIVMVSVDIVLIELAQIIFCRGDINLFTVVIYSLIHRLKG